MSLVSIASVSVQVREVSVQSGMDAGLANILSASCLAKTPGVAVCQIETAYSWSCLVL